MSNSNEYVQQLEQIERFLLEAIMKEEGKPVDFSGSLTLLNNLQEMYKLTQETIALFEPVKNVEQNDESFTQGLKK